MFPINKAAGYAVLVVIGIISFANSLGTLIPTSLKSISDLIRRVHFHQIELDQETH